MRITLAPVYPDIGFSLVRTPYAQRTYMHKHLNSDSAYDEEQVDISRISILACHSNATIENHTECKCRNK